jgi:hypothetical protein
VQYVEPALREDLDEIERAAGHLIVREVMTGRTLPSMT